MRKYFAISGYWKDDHTEFEDYIVTNCDDAIDEENDDEIFFYGLEERDIISLIALGEETTEDFVITSYEETTL